MIIRVLLETQTERGTPLWTPREIGAVSGGSYDEARGRLGGLFAELAAGNWSVDGNTENTADQDPPEDEADEYFLVELSAKVTTRGAVVVNTRTARHFNESERVYNGMAGMFPELLGRISDTVIEAEERAIMARAQENVIKSRGERE